VVSTNQRFTPSTVSSTPVKFFQESSLNQVVVKVPGSTSQKKNIDYLDTSLSSSVSDKSNLIENQKLINASTSSNTISSRLSFSSSTASTVVGTPLYGSPCNSNVKSEKIENKGTNNYNDKQRMSNTASIDAHRILLGDGSVGQLSPTDPWAKYLRQMYQYYLKNNLITESSSEEVPGKGVTKEIWQEYESEVIQRALKNTNNVPKLEEYLESRGKMYLLPNNSAHNTQGKDQEKAHQITDHFTKEEINSGCEKIQESKEPSSNDKSSNMKKGVMICTQEKIFTSTQPKANIVNSINNGQSHSLDEDKSETTLCLENESLKKDVDYSLCRDTSFKSEHAFEYNRNIMPNYMKENIRSSGIEGKATVIARMEKDVSKEDIKSELLVSREEKTL